MLPNLIIFGREISTYMLCVLAGVFTAGIYVCRTAKKRGHDNNDYIVFMLISAIGVFIGGHIMYGITNIPFVIEVINNWSALITSFWSVIKLFSIVFGGSVFYGGLLGGMAVGIIYGRKKKLDLSEYSDICAPMVPLFHFFGRIGCFLGGCCYGIESPFGFTVHGNELVPTINDVQRFPVQLFEAGLNLALFFVLAHLLKKNKFKGGLFAIYLVIYSIIRFFDEFLRGDSYRGFLFGLSTSQIISIFIFIGAVIFLIVRNKKKINNKQVCKTE